LAMVGVIDQDGVIAEGGDIGDGESDSGVFFQQLHLFFQLSGFPGVIGIDKGDEFAGSLTETEIFEAAGVPGVGKEEVFDPVIIEGSDELRGPILRTIIKNKQFEISISLLQYALDGFAKQMRTVVSRQDDADHCKEFE
jgi:hypothetical protein